MQGVENADSAMFAETFPHSFLRKEKVEPILMHSH